ncbi:MAG: hypothetical protein ACT4PY_02770 [Armatimonadota bacterium]
MATHLAPPSLTSDQTKIVQSGSWGAAGFSWIYLLAMQAHRDMVISLLGGIVPIVNIAVWVYYIINGKKLAWANRTWQGFDDFLACQRIWDRWAKWLVGIVVGFAVLGILAAILLPAFLGTRDTP